MAGKFKFLTLISHSCRDSCMKRLNKIQIPRFENSPANNGAVLISLCKIDDEVSIMYTLRCDIGTNKGRVMFPGGTSENEEAIPTALKRTKELVGLSPSRIDVWGTGPALPTINNDVMMTPVIGCVTDLTLKDLTINDSKVAECFTVPVQLFCDPQNQFHTQFKNGVVLPVYKVENYHIWGITAFFTHVFLTCMLKDSKMYRNDWMNNKIEFDPDSDIVG